MYARILSDHSMVFIAEDEFKSLPETIQNTVLEGCTLTPVSFAAEFGVGHGNLLFLFRDPSVAEHCYEEIRRHGQHKVGLPFRTLLDLNRSGGVYEDEDIEKIFELQERRCYYTGKPISLQKKNFSIDHIVPVDRGGSSWPGNLALATRTIGREKLGKSKRGYWNILSERHGADWVATRRSICETIDKKRRGVDRQRKSAVDDLISMRCGELVSEFPGHMIMLEITDDELTLVVDSTTICFPRGFLRNRDAMAEDKYFSRIVRAVLSP